MNVSRILSALVLNAMLSLSATGHPTPNTNLGRITHNKVSRSTRLNPLLAHHGRVETIDDELRIVRRSARLGTLPQATLLPCMLPVSQEDVDECSICLGTQATTLVNPIRAIKCEAAHTFHHNCIVRWFLEDSYKCPLCRQTVTGAPKTTTVTLNLDAEGFFLFLVSMGLDPFQFFIPANE